MDFVAIIASGGRCGAEGFGTAYVEARALGDKARERVRRYDWSQGVIELDRVLRQAASIRSGS